MKPWEMEWRREGASWVEDRKTVRAICEVHWEGNPLASQGERLDEKAAFAQFLASSPEMARALAAMYEWCESEGGGTYVPGKIQRATAAALKKA